MAEPLTINVQQAPKAAPAVYTVPGSADVAPLSAFAVYDGAGAATPFLAALTFYSAAGLILARVFPSTQIPAGGQAGVTFAPFLEDAAAGGIQFNAGTYGPRNVGDWLSIETTDRDPINLDGIKILTVKSQEYVCTGGPIAIISSGGPESVGLILDALNSVSINSDGADITTNSNNFITTLAAGGGQFQIFFPTNTAASTFEIRDSSNALIFQVRGDGTIHGRAAVGAITWDL